MARLAFTGSYDPASMGPRSDNRGYVCRACEQIIQGRSSASMGPRSDNRGYGQGQCSRNLKEKDSFNGSTVG